MARGQTDAKGETLLKDLPAGKHTVVLTGKPLVEVANLKGTTGVVSLLALGVGKPANMQTKRVARTLEGDMKVSDEDAKAKTLRVRVSADVPTLRVRQ